MHLSHSAVSSKLKNFINSTVRRRIQPITRDQLAWNKAKDA